MVQYGEQRIADRLMMLMASELMLSGRLPKLLLTGWLDD
jgi:hypothetical protein